MKWKEVWSNSSYYCRHLKHSNVKQHWKRKGEKASEQSVPATPSSYLKSENQQLQWQTIFYCTVIMRRKRGGELVGISRSWERCREICFSRPLIEKINRRIPPISEPFWGMFTLLGEEQNPIIIVLVLSFISYHNHYVLSISHE